ncbi:hypothetical protein [uncultured Alsobacter sp.]|uniref:hypothetical protein n=1 Tax=uncultured Alsobacter sp. TaxID=1748258 RepID=UPI0025D1580D|nr:hypothetical protein [uncultured Alsobacter sp.]
MVLPVPSGFSLGPGAREVLRTHADRLKSDGHPLNFACLWIPTQTPKDTEPFLDLAIGLSFSPSEMGLQHDDISEVDGIRLVLDLDPRAIPYFEHRILDCTAEGQWHMRSAAGRGHTPLPDLRRPPSTSGFCQYRIDVTSHANENGTATSGW